MRCVSLDVRGTEEEVAIMNSYPNNSRLNAADHRVSRPVSDHLNWNIPNSPEFLHFSNRLDAAFARVVDRWRWSAAPNTSSLTRAKSQDEFSFKRLFKPE